MVTHQCNTPPVDSRINGSWICPACGQQWLRTSRSTIDGTIRGWQRSRFLRPNQNLADAYDMEQLAEALPWYVVFKKANLRSKARVLRKLEGQI